MAGKHVESRKTSPVRGEGETWNRRKYERLPFAQYAAKMGFDSLQEMYRFQEDLGIPDHLIAHVWGVSRSTVRDIPGHRQWRAKYGQDKQGSPKGLEPLKKNLTQRQILRLVQFLCEEWKRNQRH